MSKQKEKRMQELIALRNSRQSQPSPLRDIAGLVGIASQLGNLGIDRQYKQAQIAESQQRNKESSARIDSSRLAQQYVPLNFQLDQSRLGLGQQANQQNLFQILSNILINQQKMATEQPYYAARTDLTQLMADLQRTVNAGMPGGTPTPQGQPQPTVSPEDQQIIDMLAEKLLNKKGR